MAVDNEQKRVSALEHGDEMEFGYVVPSGSLNQEGRQASIWTYSGVLADALTIPEGYLCLLGAGI